MMSEQYLMGDIMVRISTFRNMGVNVPVSALKLARAGFYCANHDRSDDVKCFACNLEVKSWIDVQDPLQYHTKASRKCPFLISLLNNEPNTHISCNWNIKSKHSFKTTEDKLNTNFDTYEIDGPQSIMCTEESGPFESMIIETSGGSSSLPSLENQDCVDPTLSTASTSHNHPQFIEVICREQTYSGWPVYMNQTPEELSKAGFVYAGRSDRVYCFSCNTEISQWQPFWKPFVEHAFLAENCEFLKKNANEDFIQQCKKEQRYPLEEIISTSVSNDHPAIQAIFEMESNCTEDLIRRTVELFFKRTKGNVPFRADNLVATFLELLQDANGGKFDVDEEEYNSIDSGVDDEEVLNDVQELTITDDIKSEMKIDSEKVDSGIDEKCVINENQTQSIVSESTNSKHSRNLSLNNSFTFTPESPAHKRSKVGTGIGDLPVNGRESPLTESDIKRLKTENIELHERKLCKVCFQDNLSVILQPCNHMVTCTKCSEALKKCPICRVKITDKFLVNIMDG